MHIRWLQLHGDVLRVSPGEASPASGDPRPHSISLSTSSSDFNQTHCATQVYLRYRCVEQSLPGNARTGAECSSRCVSTADQLFVCLLWSWFDATSTKHGELSARFRTNVVDTVLVVDVCESYYTPDGLQSLHPIWGCTSGVVYVPCIYSHTRLELP